MFRRDIAAFLLKIMCETLNAVKRYSKSNMTVFVLSLWKKYRQGLTSFGQFIYQFEYQVCYTEIQVEIVAVENPRYIKVHILH